MKSYIVISSSNKKVNLTEEKSSENFYLEVMGKSHCCICENNSLHDDSEWLLLKSIIEFGERGGGKSKAYCLNGSTAVSEESHKVDGITYRHSTNPHEHIKRNHKNDTVQSTTQMCCGHKKGGKGNVFLHHADGSLMVLGKKRKGRRLSKNKTKKTRAAITMKR